MGAKDYTQVGAGLTLNIVSKSAEDILAYIRFIDANEPWDLPPEGSTLSDLRDYYTKPAYKTTATGKRVKVRGPLADSLEEGLRDTVRVGKVKWITVLDRNTAKRDRELNGTIWDVENRSAPIPPLHINCRCRREPIEDKVEAYGNEPKMSQVQKRDAQRLKDAENGVWRKATSKSDATRQLETLVQTGAKQVGNEGGLYPFNEKTNVPYAVFGDRNSGMYGKVDFDKTFTAEELNVIGDKMSKLALDADKIGIPRLRGITKIDPSDDFEMSMGDGVLAINVKEFKIDYGRDRKKMLRDQVNTLGVKIKELEGRGVNPKLISRIRADHEKMKDELKDFKYSKYVSKWRSGDDPSKKPYVVSDYFGSNSERIGILMDHEFAHHIHNMKGNVTVRDYGERPYRQKIAKARKKFLANAGKAGRIEDASAYMAENENDGAEWFAESYALWMNGKKGMVAHELRPLLKELEEKLK